MSEYRTELQRARALAQEGDYAKAAMAFGLLCESYPDKPELHYYLGAAHYKTGNMKAARTALDRCLSIEPAYAKASALRAKIPLGRIRDESAHDKTRLKTPVRRERISRRRLLLALVSILAITAVAATALYAPDEWWGEVLGQAQENPIANEYKPNRYKRAAWKKIKETVDYNLTAPTTANYPSVDMDSIAYQGNQTYRLESYVDSNNMFGAVERNHYICVVKHDDVANDMWSVVWFGSARPTMTPFSMPTYVWPTVQMPDYKARTEEYQRILTEKFKHVLPPMPEQQR